MTNAQSLEFPPYRLDFFAERLLRGERTIPLRPKTWAVLAHLAERRGALVTRGELLDAVWEDTAVCDDNLSQSIAEIRRALGEDPRRPRFLETVHGRGFRFLSEKPATRSGAAVPAPGPGADFVGRTAELRRLESLLDDASAGRRRVAFVTGEPGIGKTALVEAFLRSLDGREKLWIARGESIEQYGAREPYMPFLEAIERLVRRSDAKRAIETFRKLAPAWSAQVAALRKPGTRVPSELTPARMLREMALALEAITADRTLVLVLEDLHWSDAATVDLLGLLARRSEPARLLVVGTYRPADAAVTDHPISALKVSLEAHGQGIEIPLEDLSRADVTSYVARRFPSFENVERLASWLHARTEGNPLFMAALADRAIAPHVGSPSTLGDAELDSAEIPGDLTAMIETQLAPLDERQRRVLDAAAVAGLGFDAAAVAAALEAPLLDVEDACARLVHTHGLLTEETVREWPDGTIGGRYTFRHALYRRFLVTRSMPGARRTFHRRIAERLERAWGSRGAEIVAELALHFDQGGDRDRAVEYLGRSGLRALGRAAFREAQASLEAALRNLAELPETPERDRRELALLRPLSWILAGRVFYSGNPLGPRLERAIELGDRLGDRGAVFDARYSLWSFRATRGGDREQVRSEVAELDRLAADLGGFRQTCAAYAGSTTIVWSGADLETGCAVGERGFAFDGTAVAEELEATPVFGVDPIAGAGEIASWALWLLGFPERSRALEERVCARAERLGGPLTRTQVLGQQTVPHYWSGRADKALELARRARRCAVEHDLVAWAWIAEMEERAALVKIHGDRSELEPLRHALDEFLRLTGSVLSSPFYTLYVESCLTLGEAGLGLAAAREALAKIEGSFDQLFEPELRRLEGELVLACRTSAGRSRQSETAAEAKAARAFEAALASARSRKARFFELRALTSLVRLRSGRDAGAKRDLEKLLATFSEGFDLPDYVAAKRLLGGRAP